MKYQSFDIALAKGELGEKIIREYLEKKGWIVYFPFTKGAHYFDMLATKDKEKCVAVDVKTKARFNNWPAQGINKKSYNEYMNFISKTNIDFYLIFVDDKNGDVHLANLAKLKNETYPNPKIIAWPLAEMTLLFNIGIENIKLLSEYDQRNYIFAPHN